MFEDLRGFIDQIESLGELRRVNGADPQLEIGALTVLTARQSKSHPALLFDQIKGYRKGFRILSNIVTTMNRSKLALGIEPITDLADPVNYLANMLRDLKPIPPKEVSDGPVFENLQKGDDIDILQFPAPKWHQLDGGNYLGTADIVILKDPDSQRINLGTYRLQVHDRKKLGIAINPGHHGGIIEEKYWERGLACPVAVSLGHDPRLATAANMYIPWGASEYEYAGWLMKKAVEVILGPITGLPIPANSELAIEGEIPPPSVESATEGPFGEFGGYYSTEGKPQPVIRVKGVYHRNDPIVLGSPPFKGVSHNGLLPISDALLFAELQRMGYPEVKKLGRAGPFLVVAMKTRYSGHARRVADFIVSGVGMRPPKYILIVDDDIDITNREEVFWAFQTRVDADESVYLVKNRWGASTDPRIPPSKKQSGDISAASLIFDATRPWAWRDQFPKTTDFPENLMKEISEKWSDDPE